MVLRFGLNNIILTHLNTNSDFVEDGDGFEIDMNGIEYEDYLSDITGYKIDKGKLYRVRQLQF